MSVSKVDDMMGLLKSLKERHGQIKACMVAKKGLEGLIMFPESFKEEVSSIWNPLSKNVNDNLLMVAKYSNVGLQRTYTELLGYGVVLVVLSMSDTALIVFMKDDNPLKEIALIVDDMEKTRDQLLNI
jgi:hypothetical protein